MISDVLNQHQTVRCFQMGRCHFSSSLAEIPFTDLCLGARKENELLPVPLQMAFPGSRLPPGLLAVPPQTPAPLAPSASRQSPSCTRATRIAVAASDRQAQTKMQILLPIPPAHPRLELKQRTLLIDPSCHLFPS